ncbi:hypothetical protein [Rhodospirillum centenum]|uniref:Uncharacterized protein n=1 Tax=Rhodospirillum centenum (strain ATCC 51521 / SW) TaxID=414684 RepID=B6IMZ6_RHOCS|nr:hypothetical protein [Rhodospirillum centenum]ACI98893.1 phage-related conserved hypothetical protein [Rhodospirillum centenum SW]
MPDELDIELFRPGTFTAAGGRNLDFSADTLAQIAAGYDPAAYDAPVVVGHPAGDAPAYGWVKGLRIEGGRLKATLHKIDPAFAELVKDGKYRKVSASFYMPDHPNNPKPGALSLRHVGFLGAQPPAVKGLKPVEFAEGDRVDRVAVVEADGFADFAEGGATMAELLAQVRALSNQVNELRARNADFAETERAAKSRENRAFVATLVKEGRFWPGFADGMAAFLDSLDGPGHVIEFAEHGETVTRSGGEFMRDFLRRQPVTIHFGELAAPDAAAVGEHATEDELAERIAGFVESERAAGRTVSYSDALRAVTLSRNA